MEKNQGWGGQWLQFDTANICKVTGILRQKFNFIGEKDRIIQNWYKGAKWLQI